MPDVALRSRFVMAGRIRTHYIEAGSNGPVVVLLHGGGPGSSGEAGFGPVIPLMAERYQVYAPDGVGGFGETDPYWPANEGTQSRVDQLELFVDTLCLDQFYLAGNSQGAWVAAKYCLEHPDRVKKLFLVASLTISGAMGLKTPQTPGLKALGAYDGSVASMRTVMEALVYDRKNISDGLIRIRNEAANRPGAADARKTAEKGQARLTGDPNLRLKFDMTHTLPKLQVPTIFAWGAEDTFAPASVGRELENMLPNIPFHFVAGAGHQVQTDQPETLVRMMTEHFSD